MDKNKFIRLLFLSTFSMLLYHHFLKPKQTFQSVVPSVNEAGMPVESFNGAPAQVKTGFPFAAALQGEEKYVTVENALFKVTFNTKGGTIQKVVLKRYKKQEEEVVLLDAQSSCMGLVLPYENVLIETKSLYFKTEALPAYQLKENEQATIVFKLMLTADQYLEQQFELSGNSYQIGYSWKAVGMGAYLTQNNSKPAFCWHMDMQCLETDYNADAAKSTVNYYLLDQTFDQLKTTDKVEQKQIDKPLKWVSLKQRFFSSAIIAQDAFASTTMAMRTPSGSKEITRTVDVSLALSDQDKVNGAGKYSFFFGPNDYKILQQVTKGFEQNLPLGWIIVKWVNQWLIIPLFAFLEKHCANYGLVIFLLVIMVKLLLAPLSYKSFISMAKMKIVKPELDKIKEKYGTNVQKAQMAQVTFYRELGINPLSGCIPILLQMPILLAMFNFFPNAIALRHAPFLWANDLSTYDSVIQLPFTIPLYGNHVSLFTLLMTLSTILYAKSSSQNSPTEGPMKGLTYVMPFTFMLVLNSFPAGLSFYYFISNILTFLQQALTKYFVDEEAIKKKLLARQQKIKQGETTSFQARVAATIQTSNKKKK
ncbi:membrane protein insertase YidC [Candidatus Cardinium hertigii]|uniref:Membrane protein insertase YidC n=1 Tax=Candidatus Cardinium hertigii TaxID=247481 RepID=A0A2Z3LGB3_9BACT|nr:membrane protein insertase YidC [Candidatus Cardinium hertigii]AWN81424.1 Membrane protein insertase YidC [Candidatus Cardinium hertigii]